MIIERTKIYYCILIFLLFACSSDLAYKGIINDSITKSTSDNKQISILTYNVKSIFDKEEPLTSALFNYLDDAEYDFIVFQELFNEKTRDLFIQNIDSNLYISKTARIDYDTFPSNLFQDSGLFLVAQYPQVDLSSLDFGDEIQAKDGVIYKLLRKELSITLDFIANKSVMGSLHTINDSTKLFLFSTHIQAIGSKTHKLLQLMQIEKFIQIAVQQVIESGFIENNNLVVLLAGDFNTDAYSDDQYANLLEYLGNPRDLHKEYHQENEEYSIIFRSFNRKMRFDYIFAYDQIRSIPLKKVRVQFVNVTDIRDAANTSISDHFALKASLFID